MVSLEPDDMLEPFALVGTKRPCFRTLRQSNGRSSNNGSVVIERRRGYDCEHRSRVGLTIYVRFAGRAFADQAAVAIPRGWGEGAIRGEETYRVAGGDVGQYLGPCWRTCRRRTPSRRGRPRAPHTRGLAFRLSIFEEMLWSPIAHVLIKQRNVLTAIELLALISSDPTRRLSRPAPGKRSGHCPPRPGG
jgi:hypothetical protein